MSAAGAPEDPPAAERRSRRRWALASAVLVVAMLVAALGLWNRLTSAEHLRRSDVYREALERVRSHPRAIESLGEPIHAGRGPSGSVEDTGGTGAAQLDVPLAGSHAEGRLHVHAERRGEVWSFERLEITLDDGRTIDLLAAPPPPSDAGEVVSLPIGSAVPRQAGRAGGWHAVGNGRRS